MSQVEYRVRPVVRYVVTRYTASEPLPCGPNGEERRTTASLETLGEFDNEQYAEEVCRVMGLEAFWAERRGPGIVGGVAAQTNSTDCAHQA